MYRFIGLNALASNLLMFLFYTSYFSYFTYALIKMDKKLLSDMYVCIFIFYTTIYGMNIIRRAYNLYFIFKNYGRTFPLVSFNQNTRDKFTTSLNVKMFMMEAFLLSHFYPGFAKCGVYAYDTELCNSLRIIVYSFEITLTVVILVLLLIIGIIVLSICNTQIDRRVVLKLFDFINFPKEILLKFKIIKFHPFDKLCNICLEDHVGHVNWVAASCSHKFHDECLNAWKIKNKQCPICNEEITTNTTESLLSVNI
jgi:hypothetical protein